MEITDTYAGMHAGVLITWIILTTLAGLIARQIVQGKAHLGLWGDMIIGIVGVFLAGWVMHYFNFDLSQSILAAQPDLPQRVIIWADVLVTSFVGALVLRLLLRFVKQ